MLCNLTGAGMEYEQQEYNHPVNNVTSFQTPSQMILNGRY